MSKKDDKNTTLNQWAWILNYQPKIEHQHIHLGDQPETRDYTHRKDVGETEVTDVTEEQTHGNELSLSASRQAILNQLLDLAEKGDWINNVTKVSQVNDYSSRCV